MPAGHPKAGALELAIQKLIFTAQHYAVLAIFVVGCWGLGRALLSRIAATATASATRDVWLETAMAATIGIGIFICAFQALAVAGVFGLAGVIALVTISVVAAGVQLPAWLRQVRAIDPGPPFSALEKWAFIVLMVVALPDLLAPAAPPAAFDELMYHLPYAREVAQSGSLGIYEWLRYPWFPYNYNLLYAAALLVGDDVLPHFLNALAGALSVWMVYRLGLKHANRVVACCGATIWLGIGDYSNALIDMGAALFVLAGCVSLWWWRESQPDLSGVSGDERRGWHWLAVAAFCLGVAAGSKYQALTFLPLIALFVVRRERRVGVWAVMLLCFLIPCIYWYARNALQTGDPFNPIGAKLFGFTNWDAGDYRRQVDDVRAHAAMPHFLTWAVVFAPFSVHWKRSAAVRAAVLFSGYSLLVWVLTSRYPRYLTTAYPLIALVSAIGWGVFFKWIAAALGKVERGRAWRGRAAPWLGKALVAVLAVVSVQHAVSKVGRISPTPESREAFLRENVPGYLVMKYLREHPVGHVYQIALSETTYFGPSPVWGDALGPWRYADYYALPAGEMASKLRSTGFSVVAISNPFLHVLTSKPDFDKYFALLYEQDGAKAFRVLPTP